MASKSARPPSKTEETPRNSSSHLDPSLQHFSDPSFDPVQFLDTSLPPLARADPSSQTRRNTDSSGAVSITELSTRTQTLLSQLSAQNARLTDTLNQLTDEILRSGGRLAYEVEVLRGDTIGLSDALTHTLQNDIRHFLPQGLPELAPSTDTDVPTTIPEDEPAKDVDVVENKPEPQANNDPEPIARLRTLIQVKTRLEEVIQVFGEAMEWPLPPSEVSITASFISVSAPEPGPEARSLEEKGREVAKKLRAQLTELLDSEGGGLAGVEAAERRVERLRELAQVWKGTAEEKARLKFVDSLARIVDERRRLIESEAARDREARDAKGVTRSSSKKSRPSTDAAPRDKQDGGGGGLFRNLQRLRDEIYLE
ncbi:hypothetical protein FQN57_000396 [Myotisia sp. PD_48]|nr:hypothetical protein FQN57_000396 [Myotisia sp. PD_48]